MRIIKPQQLILLKSGYQIGQQSYLGLSVVAGCYLSRPQQFAPEAKIWHAWNSAPHLMPVLESAEPKPYAEYLLTGHVFRDSPVTQTQASLSVGGLSKKWQLTGDRHHAFASPQPFSRMPLDHAQGWCGTDGRINPAGKPLANLEIAGQPFARPLAAASALPHHFPERDIYLQPVKAEMNGVVYRETVFPGLPAALDLRYFQMAAAEQWLNLPEWPAEVEIRLQGFNNNAALSCTLPAVQARALASYAGQPAEPVGLQRKTLWLLPDSDLVLIIFTGRIPLADPLDESVSLVMAGLDSVCSPRGLDHYQQVLRRRTRGDVPQLAFLLDAELMPEEAELGVIATPGQHPESPHATTGPDDPAIATAFYQQIRQIMDEKKVTPAEPAAGHAGFPQPVGHADPLTGVEHQHLWQNRTFSGETFSQLRGKTFRYCHFQQGSFIAATLQQCRFEHCTFEHVSWQGSRLEECFFDNVTLTACDLHNANWQRVSVNNLQGSECSTTEMQFDDCEWTQSQLVKCNLSHSRWQRNKWQGLFLDGCLLASARLEHTSLNNCLFHHCEARQLKMTRVTARATSILNGGWQKSVFSECQIVGLTVGEASDFSGVHFSHCWLQKIGFKGGVLPEARLEHCVVDEGNFDQARLTASRFVCCDMAGSRWKDARLEKTLWQDSSLQQAQFYRANLCAARLKDCNLIGAGMARIARDRATWFGDCLMQGVILLPAAPGGADAKEKSEGTP